MRSGYPAAAVGADWLARARKTADAAAGQATEAEVAACIKARGSVWSALKETLEGLSDGKCWYTEARDTVSHWQVDHYRPKSMYPWLAFAWCNLRLCGGKPNQRKSNEFPLAAGSVRDISTVGVGGEEPLLLDLTRLDDPELLTFKADGEPVCARPADPGAVERIAITLKLLDLDGVRLCEERRRKWRDCEGKLRKLRELLDKRSQQANLDGSDFVDELCLDLQKLSADDAEFTATAIACAQELNGAELVRIALRRARAIGSVGGMTRVAAVPSGCTPPPEPRSQCFGRCAAAASCRWRSFRVRAARCRTVAVARYLSISPASGDLWNACDGRAPASPSEARCGRAAHSLSRQTPR